MKPKTQFEQIFKKLRDPVCLCSNCLCEFCLNNAEQATEKAKLEEMQEPCLNCDGCRVYDGDSRKQDQRKEECEKFIISDYGVRINRKKIRRIL